MKKWLLMGLSALYAGMSAQAALAASPNHWKNHETPSATNAASSIAAARPLSRPANFDASFASLRNKRLDTQGHKRLSKPDAIVSNGLRYQRLRPTHLGIDYYDKTLDKPTFVWAGKRAESLDFVAFRKGAGAPTYARAYLRRFAGELRTGADAVNNARLVWVHDDGRGPVIARYQQVVDGYDVVNRQLNVVMDQDLNLVAISGYFASNKKAPTKAELAAFGAGPQKAMNAAFNDLDLPLSAYKLHRTANHAGGFVHFAPSKSKVGPGSVQVTAPVGAKKVLFPVGNKLVPAWLTTVQANRAGNTNGIAYAYVAGAGNGKVLYRKNLVNHETYTYRVFADANTTVPEDSPFGNGYVPFAGPVTTKPGIGHLVSVNATHGVADPWMPLNVPGFPTYETIGNNVWAYLDVAGDDGRDDPADITATTTSSNTFDYTFDFSKSPATHANREGAIVELFYVDNWLHDMWYKAGFTEKMGNAQYLNYGRGGVGGDPILAEVQDNSGRNNSNMATPPDGSSPRQQMYLFDGASTSSVKVADTTDTSKTFEFDPAYPAAFGPGNYSNVTGNLVIYNDGDADGGGINGELDACQPTKQDLTGKIAIIGDIYTCDFTVKVKNAQNAGAIAALIVYNKATPDDRAFHMGGSDPGITIPSFSISDQDANPAMAAIANGDTVSANLSLKTALDRDGSLDTQVVSHEFFHYVSNRLVGNALGLSNVQGAGMGEGWSDMDSLFLTARADDLANNPDGFYAVGGYAVSDMAGIRIAPYTTNMSVNPLTFAWVTQNPEVHGVGTVWATMLWEAYVGIYKHYAAKDPTTAYATAKKKMMHYVLDGLMATPNAPTMVEARDAILAVAKASDKTDYNIIVKAFAKRGMGFGAIAPPRDSTTLAGVTESYKTDLKSFVVQASNLNVNAEGVCDADYSLDPGETGKIKITLENNGSADLDGVTAKLSSKDDIVFTDDGKITFDTIPMFGGTASATTTARVKSATKTSEPMSIKVSFPDVGKKKDSVEEAKPFEFHFVSNQDFKAGATKDDMENANKSLYDWTRMVTGDGAGWSVDTQFSVALGWPQGNHYWYAPDNTVSTDAALVTPPIKVGNKAFKVSFDNYYQFKVYQNAIPLSGGVVEISTDGGKAWKDVTKAGGTFAVGYTGTVYQYNEYLNGRAAFVGAPANGPYTETLDFGKSLDGKTVRLRFRAGSYGHGFSEVGWLIDNVIVAGAAEPMFSKVVPEDAICGGEPPVADAGENQTVTAGDKLTLNGDGSSDYEGEVTYQWTQTAGDEVKLHDAETDTPAFTAPFGPQKLTFKLTVTDRGGQTDSDTVTVTVKDGPPTANAGSDQHVGSGHKVTLDGSGSSDAEGSLHYTWKQTGGHPVKLSDATVAKPSFTAPNGGNLRFELTVTDQGGQTDTDKVTVRVIHKHGNATPPAGSGSGGGGGTGLLVLLGLMGMSLVRRRRVR
jgi:hypothetical protein